MEGCLALDKRDINTYDECIGWNSGRFDIHFNVDSGVVFSFGVPIYIRQIITQESGWDKRAVSKTGARGLMQIMPITLKDWNIFSGSEKHTISDLFNPEINIKIGLWYIMVRIPKMLEYYSIEDSWENRLIAYNAGIKWAIDHNRQGKKLPEETIDYINKYKKGIGYER